MSAHRHIEGPNGVLLKVNESGQIEVVMASHPVLDDSPVQLPFRQYLTLNGTIGASSDMRANGSLASPVEFSINASNTHDIFLANLSVKIGDDGTPTPAEFGDIAALTNGIEVSWYPHDQGVYLIHEGLKTNEDFIRFCLGKPAFGDSTTAFLVDTNAGISEKSYIPVFSFVEFFNMRNGLRLRKNSNDRLIFKVRDNLSALTTFNIVAGGFRI